MKASWDEVSSRLLENLKNLGTTPLAAADRCDGLNRGTVHGWFPNRSRPQARHKPRPEQLRRFLEGNPEIDPAPYQDYCALGPSKVRVQVVCPDCKEPREVSQKALNDRLGTASRPALLRRADGVYEWRCGGCRSLAALRRARKRRWELWAGEVNADRINGSAISVAVKAKLTGRPKTEAHRASIAEAHVLLGRVTRPIQVCPLCELWCERGWLRRGRQWHGDCWDTWTNWRRQLKDAPPLPPPMKRGRRAGAHGNRDYHWFLIQMLKRHAHALPERLRDKVEAETNFRTTLLRQALADGQCSQYRGRGLKELSRTAVNRAATRFLKRIPGSWDSLFVSPHWGWHSRSDRRPDLEWRKKRDSRTTILQRQIPLPAILADLIAIGARDRLIVRLHWFGMKLDRIVGLTGAPLQRCERVIAASLHLGRRRLTPQDARISRLLGLGMKPENVAILVRCSLTDVESARPSLTQMA